MDKKFTGRPKPSASLTNTSQMLTSAEEIMRKSGGLSQMRTSGASFRPSSRDGRPSSSQSSSYSLSFSPNFDELSLASSIKMDIIQLQDEIDNLDMDGKLRNGKMEFMAAHITQMRKWLSLNSKISKRNVEKTINNDLNTEKLIQILKVQNTEEGLKKMFKIASLMDILLNKMTEYEIIYLLRYDEIYANLTKNNNSQNANSKQNMMAQGIDTKKFLPSQANIERLVQMYQLCAKQSQDQMSRTGGFSSIGLDTGPKLDATGIKSTDDMIKYLKKLPQKVMPEDFKELLISQLHETEVLEEKVRVANAFIQTQQQASQSTGASKGPNLEKQVKQLQAQMREVEEDKCSIFERMQSQIKIIENLKGQVAEKDVKIAHLQQTLEMAQQNQSIQPKKEEQQQQGAPIGSKPPLHKDDPEYWTRIIDETKQIYDQRQMDIMDENQSLKEKIIQKNVQLEKFQTQLTEFFQKETDFKEWKTEYFREFKKNFAKTEEYQSAYEKALLLEFDRYKKSWERKIDDLEFDLENNKKQNARQIVDIKNKLKKEEETKALLLRKLSCFVK